MRITSIILLFFALACKKEQDTIPLSIKKVDLLLDTKPTDISFADEHSGFVSTAYSPKYGSSLILKTTDGGINWLSVPVSIDGSVAINLRSVYAHTRDTVFATFNTQDHCGVCISTDGGSTWNSLLSADQTLPYTDVLYHNDRIFVTLSGGIISSSDLGKTWVSVYKPEKPGGNIGVKMFVNKKIGYAYGMDVVYCGTDCPTYSVGTLIKTIDGGETWFRLPDIPGGPTDLKFMDEQNGYVFAYGGNLYRTIDGGLNWQLAGEVSSEGSYFVSVRQGPDIYYSTGASHVYQSPLGLQTKTLIFQDDSGESFNFKGLAISNRKILFLSQGGQILIINLK